MDQGNDDHRKQAYQLIISESSQKLGINEGQNFEKSFPHTNENPDRLSLNEKAGQDKTD